MSNRTTPMREAPPHAQPTPATSRAGINCLDRFDMPLQTAPTEADRQAWVEKFCPEFRDGYLRVRLNGAAAPGGEAGQFMAVGNDRATCIDNAIAGFLVRLS